MDNPTAWVAAILGGGGLAGVLAFGKQLLGIFTGRSRRKRDEVDEAWKERDKEAAKRRQIEEHASAVRRIAIEAPCIPAESIPPWPAYRGDTGQIPTQKE
ncbi:hypothetical protein [Pseudoclavibacter sp. JSM 162008]|uniref:hypothetical protein n=1 Tax=Pseudoclavibacter sp. JSM 162008 TaxID=3229855 RepID=UPI0035262847